MTQRNMNRAAFACPRPQNLPDDLRSARERESAAQVMQAAFPRRLKRWGRSIYALSRARNDGGPLWQLEDWIRQGKAAGMTMDEAMMPVTHLQAVVRAEYGDTVTFVDATLTETKHDTAEDNAQMIAVLDRSHLNEFVIAAKKNVASLLAAIVAAEQEIERAARARRVGRCSHGTPNDVRCGQCETIRDLEFRHFLIEQGRRLGKKPGEKMSGMFCPGGHLIEVTIPEEVR